MSFSTHHLPIFHSPHRIYHVLFTICHSPRVIWFCHLPDSIHRVSFTSCHLPFVIHHVSFLLHVIYHLSFHIMCPLPRIIYHLPFATCYLTCIIYPLPFRYFSREEKFVLRRVEQLSSEWQLLWNNRSPQTMEHRRQWNIMNNGTTKSYQLSLWTTGMSGKIAC